MRKSFVLLSIGILFVVFHFFSFPLPQHFRNAEFNAPMVKTSATVKERPSALIETITYSWKLAVAEVKRQVLLRECEKKRLCPSSLQKKPHTTLDELEKHCPTSALRVGTYNIQNIQEWERRRSALLAEVNEMRASLLCLQEIRVWKGELQWIDILNHTEYYIYGSYVRVAEEKVGMEEGIAILSHFPFVEEETLQISTNSMRPRAALRVLVDIPGYGKVNLVNVHFGINDVEQCVQMLQLMHQLPKNGFPYLLAGDWNAYFDFPWPTSWLAGDDVDTFICPMLQEAPPFLVRDAFEIVHPRNELRIKGLNMWPNVLGWTFPVQNQILDSCRPDRVLFSGDYLVVCDVANIGDEAREGVYPSDHMGVVVGIVKDEGRGTWEEKQKRVLQWKQQEWEKMKKACKDCEYGV